MRTKNRTDNLFNILPEWSCSLDNSMRKNMGYMGNLSQSIFGD